MYCINNSFKLDFKHMFAHDKDEKEQKRPATGCILISCSTISLRTTTMNEIITTTTTNYRQRNFSFRNIDNNT